MVFNLFGNATESISWVPNPTTRGTSNILQSCLITTSLCVWTALHLNLKEQNDPTFLRISYQTWRKTGWLIIGLLAPEMVVYTAWYQRSRAKGFRDAYNQHFGLTPPPGKLKQVYRWLFHREAKEVASAGEEGSIEMRAVPRQEQITTIVRREKLPWTLTQGFYAQMGGFALDTVGAYPEFLLEARTTLDQLPFVILLDDTEPLIPFPSENTAEGSNKTLSSSQKQYPNRENENGEPEITRFDIASAESPQNEKQTEGEAKVDAVENTVNKPASKIPNYNLYEPLNISKKDLQDKSKANGLAKSLVCLQAAWFCVQCLARVAQALPVTLLELNTFAHSTCALLVYILWWDKPLDVEQPTYLPIQGIDAISKWSAIDGRSSPSHDIRKSPRVIISELKRRMHMQSVDRGTLSLTGKIPEGVPCEFTRFILDADVVTSDGTTYHGLLIPGRVPNYGSWLPYPNRNTPSCISYCYGVYRESSTDSWKVYDGSFEAGHEKVRTTRIPNWPKFDIEKPWIQLLFILVAFLYGGLHSLAWNSLFPSQKEQLLWRISTTIMGAGVPALICYLLSQRTSNPKLTFIPHYAPRWRIYAYRLSKPILNQRLACILRIPRERVLAELEHEGRISPPPIIWDGLPLLYKSIDKFLVFIIISLLPAYLFARVYLVVESFIQLFHLESGPAFEQPHWSTYIPHLG